MDSTEFVLGHKSYVSGRRGAQDAASAIPTRVFADYAHKNNDATRALLSWIETDNPTPQQIADELVADLNRKRQLVKLALEGRGGDDR